MSSKLVHVFLLVLLTAITVNGQSGEFNADSAFAFTEHLSVTIGPRPMGSVNENLSLEWARDKFDSFGADTAFIMSFSEAELGRGPVITHSGVAVGIFKGKTDSAIVIGGHIDSDGYFIPGANDNASGTAAAMELARIWSQRDRHYTMIFCGFGGEERGLIGSQYFVDNYPGINNVALMISTDMAGAPGAIETIFETYRAQAPDWLVKDAFEMDHALGFNRLSYPTHFESINSLMERASGSDHMSFLNAGIPAIDFTVGINDSPIHTAQDRIEHIDRKAMGEYGRFVDALVQKYQTGGIPEPTSGRFMLYEMFGWRFYFPVWLITTFNIVALIIGVLTFIYIRSQRQIIDKEKRARFSGLKLLLILLIMTIFMHFGETLIQLIRGYRTAWVGNETAFLLYTLIWMLAGLWSGLTLTKNWRFSDDPYVYALRYYILVAVFLIPAIFIDSRLALYPALMIFLFSISAFTGSQLVRTILALAAPLILYRLLANEELGLTISMSAMSGLRINTFLSAAVYNSILTLLMLVTSLPLLFAGGYAVSASAGFKNLIKKFRTPTGGYIMAALIIGFGVYLLTLPVYAGLQRPAIRATATYELPKQENELEIAGSEYFKDLQVQGDSLDEFYNGREYKIDIDRPFHLDWLNIDGEELVSSGELDTIQFSWWIHSKQPAERFTLSIRPDTATISDAQSELPFSNDERLLVWNWEGFFPDTIVVSGRMAVVPGAKLIRNLSARYSAPPLNLNLKSDLADISYRTTIDIKDTLDLGTN